MIINILQVDVIAMVDILRRRDRTDSTKVALTWAPDGKKETGGDQGRLGEEQWSVRGIKWNGTTGELVKRWQMNDRSGKVCASP